ncbi:MAG: uroporphyrinogen decarboxylase [Anaerolineae bacterium]
MNDRLLKALRCQNDGRPPIWLMRQAGRYLPEYRLLREKYSLWEMFHQPEIAAEVTRLPLKLLKLDAAILFSDITVIAEALGMKVHFPEKGGPLIEPSLSRAEDVDRVIKPFDEVALSHVTRTIQLLKGTLSVPLIGFCGGPFTVASYMAARTHREDWSCIQAWLSEDPQSFHVLLDKIAKASIDYLRLQIDAGVEVIQIFDSWAIKLTPLQFWDFCGKYLKQMCDALKTLGVPVIIFCRGSSLIPEKLAEVGADAISFDWHEEIPKLRLRVPPHIAVQGNIDPQILLGSKARLLEKTEEILQSMRKEKGFIFNLGHGVLPLTPVEHVQELVEVVTSFHF